MIWQRETRGFDLVLEPGVEVMVEYEARYRGTIDDLEIDYGEPTKVERYMDHGMEAWSWPDMLFAHRQAIFAAIDAHMATFVPPEGSEDDDDRRYDEWRDRDPRED